MRTWVEDWVFRLYVLRKMLSGALEEWKNTCWGDRLHAFYCCDGRECGCGGATNKEVWECSVEVTTYSQEFRPHDAEEEVVW